MKAISLIYGYFVVNLAIWSISTLALLTTVGQPVISPGNITSLFSLDAFTVLTGLVGGGVIGILAMVTRNYALSTGVLVLWIMGILIKPIRDIFVGLPLLINTVFAQSGAVATVVSQIVVAFASFTLFMFIVEVVMGRDILG